jgi:type I restriction-modification system DNA methylase subunit
MTTPFETYISKVETDLRGGKATEHTYRGALEIFMESLERGIEASNDPKHIECGAPDFIVEKRKVPLGYVETKDVGEPLDKIEKSDQLKRYLKALNNLVLTDYLEFRWYVNGEKKRTVRVASVVETKHAATLRIEPNAEANLTQLFKDFYATETPTVHTPKELANRLAGVTHFIRDRIFDVLTAGEPSIQKSFAKRYAAFKDLLLPALKEEEFADLYAQTMTYGLFAAKLSAPENADFTLTSAYQFLFGNKFLRRLFSDVSEELDEIEIIRPYLLDIVSLLNRAHFDEILADFGKRTKTEDPVVHFYETFLATYDPKLRASRGVFYTPEPVVQFIVNAVDYLLKTRFNLSWGLADSTVKVLDPATGTGTFLYYVIQKIYEEVVTNRKQAGQWKQKSKELLNRIFGFELLIAPYVVSHLKLGLLLKTLGAPLEGKDERLHVYLTNTLEEGVTRSEQLAGLGHYIAEEASDAAFVKKNQEIMVVMGNPPYSGNSANTGEWITNLVRDSYYPHDEIKEQNPKMLLDDYVKFIRFGEWRINQTGHGILAFITNHGYLDNPTFRGMRQHLMTTFDEIYVLDLHGNSKKKEKTPDGGKDENVFDIQQGVAIILAVKHQRKNSEFSENSEFCAIHHASLWGKREEKYAALRDSDLDDIEWPHLQPNKPFYLFAPQDISLRDEYEKDWKVTDIFPVNSSGLNSLHDGFVIHFEKSWLSKMIDDAVNPQIPDNLFKDKYQIEDSRDWKLKDFRKKAIEQGSEEYKKNLIKCLYRPFDERWIVLNDDFVGYARWETTKHFLYPSSMGFATSRQSLITISCLAGNLPFAQHKIVDPYNRSYIFPLYLFTTPEEMAGTLFAQTETTRKPNLAPEFIEEVEEKLKLKFNSEFTRSVLNSEFSPEDIFHYAYAVFHSPTYRTRYAEFLKIDFPRLPITSDKKLFRKLAGKGRELVELHLLKSAKVEDFVTTYPEAGDNKVEKVAFKTSEVLKTSEVSGRKGKVFINTTQFFGKVPEEVWEFKVGGYQVCEKWLKDRKGRVLSGEDITHYQRVVVSLKETIRLMKEIEKSIVKWPME